MARRSIPLVLAGALAFMCACSGGDDPVQGQASPSPAPPDSVSGKCPSMDQIEGSPLSVFDYRSALVSIFDGVREGYSNQTFIPATEDPKSVADRFLKEQRELIGLADHASQIAPPTKFQSAHAQLIKGVCGLAQIEGKIAQAASSHGTPAALHLEIQYEDQGEDLPAAHDINAAEQAIYPPAG